MPKTNERFFIETPIPTSKMKSDSEGSKFLLYLNEKGKGMMWSADFPLPAIGSRVFIRMNSIGWAVVKGYFESFGYLGVMTLPINPPAWLRAQQQEDKKDPKCPNWAKAGIGCEFGSELSLQEPDVAASA